MSILPDWFNSVLTNGFLPLVPVMLWNIILASKLPPTLNPSTFNDGVPVWLLRCEDGLRSVVFIIPFFMRLNIKTSRGEVGFVVFVAGVLIYFFSWILQILWPESRVSRHIIGFAAPAYTPLIWFTGLSLMGASFYFDLKYSYLYLLVPAFLFTVFHTFHSVVVHRLRVKKVSA